MKYKTVLVAINLEADCLKILDKAELIAKKFSSQLIIVTVIEPPVELLPISKSYYEYIKKDKKRSIEEISKTIDWPNKK